MRCIPWLAALEESCRDAVLASLPAHAAVNGDVICRVGERPSCWMGVVEGLVKMSSYSAEGRTVKFTVFPAGGWFGEGTILKGEAFRYEIQVLQTGLLACQ